MVVYPGGRGGQQLRADQSPLRSIRSAVHGVPEALVLEPVVEAAHDLHLPESERLGPQGQLADDVLDGDV